MNPLEIVEKFRDVERFQHIILVFAKYGAGFLVEQSGLRVPLVTPVKGAKKKLMPERLRLAFEELGPTFVKFGQILSTRPDIFPQEYIQEFKKLQDKVPPFPRKEALKILRSELGKNAGPLIEGMSKDPIASASISQVYKVTFKKSGALALKIQRPNIETVIDKDIQILYAFAKALEKNSLESRNYNPMGIVREFDQTVHQEMNFLQEAKNIQKFRELFHESTTIDFPEVLAEKTTRNVLTMKFIDGIPVSRISTLKSKKYNLEQLAKKGADAFFTMVFEHGFFHADPHAGNIFVLKNEKIVFLDCGMVGTIDDSLLMSLGSLIEAFVSKDAKGIINVFEDLEIVGDDVKMKDLERDVGKFISKYHESSLGSIRISQLMNELMSTVALHHIEIPPELTMLGKALATIEGIGRELDPGFDVVKNITPFVKRLRLRQFSPQKLLRDFSLVTNEFNRLVFQLPRELFVLLKRLRRGDIRMKFEHQGLEKLSDEIRHSSNLLSYSFLVAALMISSSLVVQAEGLPRVLDLPLGIIGYIISALLAFFWLIAIITGERK